MHRCSCGCIRCPSIHILYLYPVQSNDGASHILLLLMNSLYDSAYCMNNPFFQKTLSPIHTYFLHQHSCAYTNDKRQTCLGNPTTGLPRTRIRTAHTSSMPGFLVLLYTYSCFLRSLTFSVPPSLKSIDAPKKYKRLMFSLQYAMRSRLHYRLVYFTVVLDYKPYRQPQTLHIIPLQGNKHRVSL